MVSRKRKRLFVDKLEARQLLAADMFAAGDFADQDEIAELLARPTECGFTGEWADPPTVEGPELPREELILPDDLDGLVDVDETTVTTGEVPEGALVDENASDVSLNLGDEGSVRYELPGEGGEYYTGGFLELNADGTGSILAGGDIVEVVEGHTLTENEDGGLTLTVTTRPGFEFSFTMDSADSAVITDAWGNEWTSESENEPTPIGPESEPADETGGPDSGVDETTVTTGEVPEGALVDETGSLGPDDGLDGDINNDGVVNAADLNMIASEWGQEVGDNSPLDLNGDGVIGAADLNILASNWMSL